jgi:dienelactone hydrolase
MCVLGVSLWGTAAPGGEPVTFKSADSAMNASIPATLYRPSGAGPFPGVVLLHDCGGLHPYQADWAAWLQNLDYVAILPDSLSPRNLTTACAGNTFPVRDHALDGLGALAYLRSRPDVIAAKVAVMGWSHGGASALISASARFIERSHPAGGGYQVAIALYPVCSAFQQGDLAAPLLMLMGSADDWTPPAQCVERGTALKAAGAAIEWTIYPGAMHGFDQLGPARVLHLPGGHTYHLEYNATAAGDAHTQVQRFLSTHLQ